jgi:hypothetical protein
MRTIRGVATSVALAAAVSGCSVYEDLTTSDFAKQDADAIVAAASEAMQDVSSLRLTGQVRDGGEQYFIDLSVDRDDRCTGTLRIGGSHLDVRRLGDRAWVKGEAGAFNRLSGSSLPADALQRLSTSWLPLDGKAATSLCDFDRLLKTFEVVEFDADAGGPEAAPASVVDESSLDGHPVVQLTASPGGGHDEMVWVRSEAPHHVVKIESTATQDGGTIAFSAIGEDVEVEAPDRKDVLRSP